MPESDPDRTDFTEIWDATAAGAVVEKVDQLKTDPAPLRKLRFFDFVLDRLGDPKRPLDRPKALKMLGIPQLDQPAPAEVHFTTMLLTHAPEDSPADSLRRAIALRARAERAALGVYPGVDSVCEQVVPWIAPLIRRADEQRRQGEDLLFATDPEHLRQAAAALDQAETLYRQAESQAGQVRAAILVHDRALADLPDYTRYLAHRYSVAEATARGEPAAVLVDHLEKLWGQTHTLAAALEQPSDPAPLTAKAAEIDSGLKEIEDHFADDLDAALTRPADLPRDWQADVAREVPFWETPRRNRRELSSRAGTVRPDANVATRQAEWVEKRSLVQGRLALAQLGPRWFDAFRQESGSKDLIEYQEVLKRLGDLAEHPVSAEWTGIVADMGDQIGRRWRGMARKIDQLLSTGVGNLDPKQALANLRTADALARQLDGGVRLGDDVPPPTWTLRKRLLVDLLLNQTERDWLDHWYGADATARYYEQAGDRYLEDADALAPRSTVVADAKQRLHRPDTLRLTPLDRHEVALTTERHRDLTYRLEAADGATVPPGFAVVWGQTGKDLAWKAPSRAGLRAVREVGTKPAATDATPSQAVAFTVGSPLLDQAELEPPRRPATEDTTFQAVGFYRGRQILAKTPISLHPAPEIVAARDVAPRGADIAVEADPAMIQRFGAGNGAVAVVLDCSGSMGDGRGPHGPLTDSKWKFVQACRALEEVLNSVPPGTMVSLWVFSEWKGQDFHNQKQPATATIQQLVRPVSWNSAQAQEAMKQVKNLIPFYETPLVDAMLRARDDLLRVNTTGFKTLVVLTDGMDTEYQKSRFEQITTRGGLREIKDKNAHADLIARDLQPAFGNTGIMVNTVIFGADPDEKALALRQLGVIERLPLPGKIYTVEKDQDPNENARRLAETLSRGLEARAAVSRRDDRSHPGGRRRARRRADRSRLVVQPAAGRRTVLRRGGCVPAAAGAAVSARRWGLPAVATRRKERPAEPGNHLECTRAGQPGPAPDQSEGLDAGRPSEPGRARPGARGRPDVGHAREAL